MWRRSCRNLYNVYVPGRMPGTAQQSHCIIDINHVVMYSDYNLCIATVSISAAHKVLCDRYRNGELMTQLNAQIARKRIKRKYT